MSDANHDQAPRPHGKVVDFDKITTLDQALDYILAGFHGSVDAAHKHPDKKDAWNAAAAAYLAAHVQMSGLKALPGDHLPKAKELIAAANKEGDKASGKANA
jgi:hypothetical protein